MNARILLGLNLALLSSAAFAQTSASTSATAKTTIYVPITITKTADLNFGDVFAGSTTGSVKVDPSGAAPATTGTGVSLGVHASSYATYSMTGQKSAAFTLTLPTSTQGSPTVNMTGPGPNIPVYNFTASIGGGATTAGPTLSGQALAAGGTQTIAVGATMGIDTATNQTQGDYSGTFTVTVAYN